MSALINQKNYYGPNCEDHYSIVSFILKAYNYYGGLNMKYSEIPVFGNLKGIRVAASGSAISFGTAATMLAENGADVINIENCDSPDVIRGYPFIYVQEHRNQRQLGLNIISETGQIILERIIKNVDILITAAKGGSWEKWGLSDKKLWEWNSKLAIVHISGYGEYGDEEYFKRPSYDFTSQCFSGHALLNGLPSKDVDANYMKPVTSDLVTGVMGGFAALLAYAGSQRTGKGESTEVTQYETLLRLQSHYPMLGFTFGMDQRSFDGVDQYMAADAFYHTKDGAPICIAVTGPKQTKNMLPLIGLAGDKRFEGISTVMKYMDKDLVEDFLNGIRIYVKSKNLKEIETELNALAIPCTRVLKYSEMKEHPHYKAREDIIQYRSSFVDMEVTGPAAFPKCKKNPQNIYRGGAKMGEDNEDILTELGFSSEELQQFYDEKVLKKGDKNAVNIKDLLK
jgi:L-carnitine CoA-transferase